MGVGAWQSLGLGRAFASFGSLHLFRVLTELLYLQCLSTPALVFLGRILSRVLPSSRLPTNRHFLLDEGK